MPKLTTHFNHGGASQCSQCSTTRLLKAVTVKSIGVTAFFLICVSPFCVVFFKVVILYIQDYIIFKTVNVPSRLFFYFPFLHYFLQGAPPQIIPLVHMIWLDLKSINLFFWFRPVLTIIIEIIISGQF